MVRKVPKEMKADLELAHQGGLEWREKMERKVCQACLEKMDPKVPQVRLSFLG